MISFLQNISFLIHILNTRVNSTGVVLFFPTLWWTNDIFVENRRPPNCEKSPFQTMEKTHFLPRKDICTAQDFSFNDSIGPILWQFLGIYSRIVVGEMGIGKGKLETSFVSINYFPTFAVSNLHNLSWSTAVTFVIHYTGWPILKVADWNCWISNFDPKLVKQKCGLNVDIHLS